MGLILGLGVTEWVFRHRDHAAFPFVNAFESDPECGVKLEPGASTRVGVAGERVTTVRTNSDGFRGAEWPAKGADDVLVVGDSQSFGLGVEEDEAFPAKLSFALRDAGNATAVLDASVPTYGPPEYETTITRVLARRRPATLIVSINLLNDFFELDAPNRARHIALDGWAIRPEVLSPGETTSPFVEAIIRRSHVAYALWRVVHQHRHAADVAPLTGDFHDLVNLVTSAEQSDSEMAASAEAERQKVVEAAQSELAAARAELVALVRKYEPIVRYTGATGNQWRDYIAENGVTTDQVFDVEVFGCGAFQNGSRYRARFSGDVIRTGVESLLKDFARTPWMSAVESGRVVHAFARRDAAEEAVSAPPPPLRPMPHAHPADAMNQWLGRMHATWPGTRIVVVAIPLDVQTSDRARALRGSTADDVAALDRLVDDLTSSTAARGDIGVDPTRALREIGDAGYLSDGHLSREGHAAIASAIANALTN